MHHAASALIEIAQRLTHEYESLANKGKAFGFWQWKLVAPNRYLFLWINSSFTRQNHVVAAIELIVTV